MAMQWCRKAEAKTFFRASGNIHPNVIVFPSRLFDADFRPGRRVVVAAPPFLFLGNRHILDLAKIKAPRPTDGTYAGEDLTTLLSDPNNGLSSEAQEKSRNHECPSRE
jgi:hypothetical protein